MITLKSVSFNTAKNELENKNIVEQRTDDYYC